LGTSSSTSGTTYTHNIPRPRVVGNIVCLVSLFVLRPEDSVPMIAMMRFLRFGLRCLIGFSYYLLIPETETPQPEPKISVSPQRRGLRSYMSKTNTGPQPPQPHAFVKNSPEPSSLLSDKTSAIRTIVQCLHTHAEQAEPIHTSTTMPLQQHQVLVFSFEIAIMSQVHENRPRQTLGQSFNVIPGRCSVDAMIMKLQQQPLQLQLQQQPRGSGRGQFILRTALRM